MEILDVWNDVYPFAGIGCAGSFARRKWKHLVEDVENIQQQLGDHYEYAAWLCERLDNLNWLVNDGPKLAKRLNELHVRFTIVEKISDKILQP